MNIASHIIAALNGPQVTEVEKKLILKEKILGFILFSRNIECADQLISLNQELKALAREAHHRILLCVDQEGGRVKRLPEPFSQIRSMREWATIDSQTKHPDLFFQLGKILGSEVKAAGFDINFAPLVDIDLNKDNPIIGDRSFSHNPETVYRMARDLSRGLLSESTIPCLKHFPGHGNTTKDSHKDLPVDERSLKEIIKTDLVPYEKLIEENLAPSIMTAHVLYPKIDKNHPATLSRIILQDLLRSKLKYNHVVFSDDMMMKAIADHHDIYQATLSFMDCGGDVALICEKPELTQEMIERFRKEKVQNGFLSKMRQSQKRIASLFMIVPTKEKFASYQKVTQKNQETLLKLQSQHSTCQRG